MLDVSLLAPEEARGLKRSEYERLVGLGVFEDERVELLHGVIVEVSPNHPAHASPIQQLTQLLVPALAGRAIVRVQLSLLAAGESIPEPDLAVVPLGDYRQAHPDRAHLVIEVADSSLRKDRGIKAPLYAASGFEEYWIVDTRKQAIAVFRRSDERVYREVSEHGLADAMDLMAFPDVAVRVADVFG